jgi:thioredoxin 1
MKEQEMADDAKVLDVTDSDFADEVEGQEGLSMVDFWATWCGPCRLVAPIVEELAEEYGDQGLRVAKLDVDSNPKTASRFNVRSIPSILFFKDGKMVDKVVGAVPRPSLEEKVKQHLG